MFWNVNEFFLVDVPCENRNLSLNVNDNQKAKESNSAEGLAKMKKKQTEIS